jgi:hypothetical protein
MVVPSDSLQYTNRHLIDDLQNRLDTSNLLDWLDAEANQLSFEGRLPGGHVHFSEALLQKRRINRIRGAEVIGKACIKPSEDEYYEITYNPVLSHNALRFAIAHEIGHTYWFKPGGGAKPLSPLQRRLGRDPDIEYLCNRFAESLLLPLNVIRSLELQEPPDVPRLDLIQTLSAKYKIDERVVARKLFASKESSLVGLVCLQELAPAKWTTRWCVIPNKAYSQQSPTGFGIPLCGKKRTVPTQMIPNVRLGRTSAIDIDGRWWQGLKQLPASVAKVPFERMSHASGGQAFAFRISNFLYLALPKL